MTTSKKVTDLPAATAVTADDLFMIVNDPLGTPASQKITAKQVLESNVVANVAVTQFVVANSFLATYTATPANSTAVPAGFAVGTFWSDGSYIYYVTGASALKRSALSTW